MRDRLATITLRNEHRLLYQGIEMLKDTARRVPYISDQERVGLIESRIDFLRQQLIPHTEVEENILYPQWQRMIDCRAAIQLLVFEHQQIIDYLGKLKDATLSDSDYLQEALYGLYALIKTHLDQEEELVFPAFDAAPETAARVIAEMDMVEQVW